MGDLKGIQKHQNRRNLIPRVLSLASRKNLVAAGLVEMCVNKLCSGGRSSTKFWRLDDEILSGVGENSCFKMALNFLSELRASCVAFRLVAIRLFSRQTGYLFREFVLEERLSRRPSRNRIRIVYLDLHVHNLLVVNLHTHEWKR